MVRDLTILKNAVLALLGIWMAVTLVSAWSHWNNYAFLKRITAGDFDPSDDVMAMATRVDDISNIIMWSSIASFALCVVAFCIWTYQAARNAKQLSSFPQKIGPGWAVGWYFVPFANFWKPFQGMREIWWRSSWPKKASAPLILNVWWILWVGLSVVSNTIGRLFRADDPEILATASAIAMVVAVAWTAPVLLLMWIVDRVTRMQVAKFAANPRGPDDSWVSEGIIIPSGNASAV